jgi:hypothetical protein
MSRMLSVFAVNVEELAAVIGSGDLQLVQKVALRAVNWFADIDELVDPDDEDDEMPTPTCLQALTQLIEGVDPKAVPVPFRYVYGYVFQALCRHFGEELDGICPIAGSSWDWAEGIDRFLTEAAVPLRLTDLIFSGCPVPIPETYDEPMIGWLSPEKIAQGLEPLRSLLLTNKDNDPESTAIQFRQWVERAAARPGYSLVSFLS